jgi:hypothetical protein
MSFSFWHKPYKPNSEQGGQNTDLAIFGLGKYFYNASVTLWCSNGTVLTYIKGDTGISWQAIPSHIALSADDWLKEHHWSITFSGTNGWSQYKVYHNGMPLSTTSLNPAITAIDESFYGIESFGGASPDAIYRDLTVYNRVLTDDEVKALYNSSFNYNSEEGVCT